MPLAPDVPYEIGDAAFGGFVAGPIVWQPPTQWREVG